MIKIKERLTLGCSWGLCLHYSILILEDDLDLLPTDRQGLIRPALVLGIIPLMDQINFKDWFHVQTPLLRHFKVGPLVFRYHDSSRTLLRENPMNHLFHQVPEQHYFTIAALNFLPCQGDQNFELIILQKGLFLIIIVFVMGQTLRAKMDQVSL